jgi:hypothetical protein
MGYQTEQISKIAERPKRPVCFFLLPLEEIPRYSQETWWLDCFLVDRRNGLLAESEHMKMMFFSCCS